MATNTTIQYLETQAVNEFGATIDLGASPSDRRQIETFLTVGTIVAGDWVAFDTTQTGAARVVYAVQSGVVATGNGLTVGVALTGGVGAAGAPVKVDVVVSGYVATANVDTATVGAAGIVLEAAGAVAGRAQAADAGSFTACGVSLAAAVGNVGPVWVYKKF